MHISGELTLYCTSVALPFRTIGRLFAAYIEAFRTAARTCGAFLMAGHKALFLSAPSPMTAAAMRGWLAAGNEIAGLRLKRKRPWSSFIQRTTALAVQVKDRDQN